MTGRAVVAAAAPGAGPGFWAGAPSTAQDMDGSLVLAYRLRLGDERGSSVVIAVTEDGERVTEVARLEKARFHAESLERPALVRMESGWRLYVSCATPGTKHWRIDALDAATPAELAGADARTVFPGSPTVGVKDPVIRVSAGVWHAWICCHPLGEPGEEDRMTTAYATSDEGLTWRWHGEVLAGREGRWDARGARVTAVFGSGLATYDGRATKEENFAERTGVARLTGTGGELAALDGEPIANIRYLDVVEIAGGYRVYYEAPLPDGSHELRTQVITGSAPKAGAARRGTGPTGRA